MRMVRRGASRGQALVEFALILPFLAFFLMAIIELGRGWNIKQVVTDASREGARLAVVYDPTVTPTQVMDLAKQKVQRAGLDTNKVNVFFLDATLTVCADPLVCFHRGTGQITSVQVVYNCPTTVPPSCFPILNRVVSVLRIFGATTPLSNRALGAITSMRNE